jgi:hypothetical protein
MLFDLLFNRLNQDQMALMATMARKIWFRRNALAHPKSIVEEATKACADFKQFNSPHPTRPCDAGDVNAVTYSWQPPPRPAHG